MAKTQSTSRQEIENLFGIVERDRSQSSLEDVHLDTRFELAYNAALQLSTIIVRLRDLRVGRIGHHRETFRIVKDLVPQEFEATVSLFDQARRKRNHLVYDQAGIATEKELTGLQSAVDTFERWVRKEVDRHFA